MRHTSRRMACAVVLTIVGLLGLPVRGPASQLVPPAAGPQDASLAGNVVALPLNPASALFHNPAQLTLLPNSVTAGGLGIHYYPHYANPLGYHDTSRELPFAPSLGYVTDRWAPLQVGIGLYGALGFTYKYKPDPAHGVPNNFYTELAVLTLAPAIAYSLTPDLHVGLEINPSYGRLRYKTPSPVGRIKVDVRGGGLFGTVGVLYTPTAQLSLGVGYKTPGTIWMAGRAHVAGRGDQATFDFQLPQTLEFGAAYQLTPGLTLVAQSRWVEFSAFEDTELRFARRPFLNRSAVSDARDRFRLGGGVQYVLWPGVTLQVGFSWERWAIKSASLAPTLHDHTEYYLFPTGITIERGLWQVHLMAGRYSLDQAIFGLQGTRRLGMTDHSEPPP